LPIVSGISYEFIKLSNMKKDNFLVRIFITPGMLIQKLTTKQPNQQQIETAIISLKAALGEDLSSYANINIIDKI
jgi:uncharacterized protein YqhQ